MAASMENTALPYNTDIPLPNGHSGPDSPRASPRQRGNSLSIERNEIYRRELCTLARELRSHAASGLLYYGEASDANGRRFYGAFASLHDHVGRCGIEPSLEYILSVAHLYDFDPSVPGNGYRSVVTVVERCCQRLLVLCQHITSNRASYLFRGEHYGKELDAYVTSLGQLRACLYYLLKLITYCPDGRLFPDEGKMSAEDYLTAGQLLEEVETLSQECFYGRCLGFQFCDSMSGALSTINLVLASFSDGYERTSAIGKFASSVLGSRKYIMDPELKAQRIVEVTRNGDINFCKAFWSLAENPLMHKMPLVVCPAVCVDKVMQIPPDALSLPLRDGSGLISIFPPCAHTGPGPVNVRLISAEYRLGQATDRNVPESRVLPKSDGLVLHIHGGGFVAQSSASHEVYLRHWAQDIGVPILCVDYSLAPEYPYPRQLEEVFFAYCWAINNASLLGWSGRRVCLVGDSAGGTLTLAAALTAVSYGVRVPDGLLSIYGCMLVKYAPSPSRILALMDPLLPLGVLPKCLAAYTGFSARTEEETEVFQTPEAGKASPSKASHPLTYFITQHSAAETLTSENTVGLTNRGTVANELEGTKLTDGIAVQGTKLTDGTAVPNAQPTAMEITDEIASAVSRILPSETPRERISAVSNDSEPRDSTTEEDSFATPSILVEKSDSLLSEATTVEDSDIARALIDVDSVFSSTSDYKSANSRLTLTAGTKSDSNSSQGFVRRDSAPIKTPSSPNSARRESVLNKSCSTPTFVTPAQSPYEQRFHSASMSPVDFTISRSSFGERFCVPTYAKTCRMVGSQFGALRGSTVGANPFLSPLLAEDELLMELCPVYLLTCHLDPMLDDSVMLARRLRALGRFVRLDLLAGLPHGFLNFALVSGEAKAGSTLCTMRIRHILAIDKDYSELR